MLNRSGLGGNAQSVFALVLDPHLQSSLPAIRSLGTRGVPICAGSHRRTAMGLFSRFVTRSFVHPPPLENRLLFFDAIRQQVRALGKCAVLTFSDSTLLPLVDDIAAFGDSLLCVLPSSPDSFRTAFDKSCTIGFAASVDVETPRTFLCTSLSDLE